MALSVEGSEDTVANQLIAAEPEHCPGPESLEAGKADPCQACPNQKICASAPKGPDPDIPLITQRLAGVKHKILVSSILELLADRGTDNSFVDFERQGRRWQKYTDEPPCACICD